MSKVKPTETHRIYCIPCGRVLYAINREEVENNEEEHYLFKHDAVEHEGKIEDMVFELH